MEDREREIDIDYFDINICDFVVIILLPVQLTDDISEARLRALWVTHGPKPSTKPDQPENGQSATQSEDAEPAAEGDAESAANGSGDGGGEPEVDLYKGFDEEPFVRAAAQFNSDNYHGILELLTEAIDRGKYVPFAMNS